MNTDNEEKYVNGCRLSSSLLELQPFKVVVAEPKSVTDKEKVPTEKVLLTAIQKKNKMKGVRNKRNSNEDPLLSTNNIQDANATSVSCDNIFDASSLQVTLHNTNTDNSKLDPEFVDRKRNSFPKAMQLSGSRERLVGNEPLENRVSPEHKKAKPKKPNRDSLRKSRQDIGGIQTNLQSTNNLSSPPHNGLSPDLITPGHDYEELPSDRLTVPTDVMIVQQRKMPQTPMERQIGGKIPDNDVNVGFTPIAFQNKEYPNVQKKTKNPRQRLNPMYADLHMNMYEHGAACEQQSSQNKRHIRCFRCIVAGVIIAVFLSFISIVFISFFILGFLDPLRDMSVNSNSGQNLSEKLMAYDTHLEQQKQLISKLTRDIHDLNISTINTGNQMEIRFEKTKNQLVEAVKSLNISALKGPSTADVAKCVHKTFGIGTSPTRNEINSGKYFAEKGFVTTGVSCSASIGYVAYLNTREEDIETDENSEHEPPRTVYSCTCHKSPNLVLSRPGERVECSIHYWQCPVL